MRTLEIPVKFQKGDEVYTTKQIRVEHTCNVCEGKGRILYFEKEMRCPECMGIGKFTSNKQMSVVCEEPFVISSIKIGVNGNGVVTSLKYKGYCGLSQINRAEENLFSTKAEAQKKCDDLNKERTYVRIEDIIIPDLFKATIPSTQKIQDKLEYYKNNKKFGSEIIINKDNVLKDGYITYLICKMLNIETIKVVVE